jgi:Tfp pilus assembly protein PilE
MGLRGQGSRFHSERGYAMAALLIAVAILAILMSVAMPVWRQEARREKEAELVFRGEQYARAIALYRFKNMQMNQQAGNVFPPSIEALVEGRYLRKKYKDPMTKDGEFMIVPLAMQANPGQPGANPQRGGRSNAPQPPIGQPPTGQAQAGGGMIGVRSKSEETSLRSYRGQTRYDQWAFTFNVVPRPGGATPAANTPDGRGNQPGVNNPGGAGRNNRGATPRGSNPGGFNTPGAGRTGQPPTFPPPGGRSGTSPRGRGPG